MLQLPSELVDSCPIYLVYTLLIEQNQQHEISRDGPISKKEGELEEVEGVDQNNKRWATQTDKAKNRAKKFEIQHKSSTWQPPLVFVCLCGDVWAKVGLAWFGFFIIIIIF